MSEKLNKCSAQFYCTSLGCKYKKGQADCEFRAGKHCLSKLATINRMVNLLKEHGIICKMKGKK